MVINLFSLQLLSIVCPDFKRNDFLKKHSFGQDLFLKDYRVRVLIAINRTVFEENDFGNN